MTGSGNKTLWTEDTIAGAILGCVGCFFVQAQLQTLAARVNSPVLSAVAHWWPALLIVAGLAILFSCRKPGGDSPKERASRSLGGGK
jgi:heme A synthase